MPQTSKKPASSVADNARDEVSKRNQRRAEIFAETEGFIGEMSPVERYVWQMAEIATDLAMAREEADVTRIAALDTRLESLGSELDKAREREERLGTNLEKTPSAIGQALRKREALIAGLEEYDRRRQERRKAAERAAKAKGKQL